MGVAVKSSKDEPQMHLLLNHRNLLLISLRSDFTESLGNFSFAQSYDSLVLKIGAQGYLDKPLVGGN